MAAAFPEELKPYKRFLVQANQIQKVDPKIAYYCRLHALTKMLAKPDAGGLANPRDPVVKDIVNGVMAKLESDKKTFAEEPLNADDDYEVVKTMAENIFANADSQDRDGDATMKTSHAFLASFVLYEVLEVFSGKNSKQDAEIQQKLKYAKWKAADIAKALKEGRTPAKGGPNEKLGDDLDGLGGGDDGDESSSAAPPARKFSDKARNLLPPPDEPSVPDDDDDSSNAGGGSSAPPPDLPPPPRGQSFRRLLPPPAIDSKKNDEEDLPSYLDVSAAGGKDIEPKTPRSVEKIKHVAAKVKKQSKGINPKDAAKMKKLKEIEVLAREALSAIRFNDTPTARDKLREAIGELDRLGGR